MHYHLWTQLHSTLIFMLDRTPKVSLPCLSDNRPWNIPFPPYLPDRYIFRRQQGLLGLAFGPMFGVSGYPSYFYLSYTTQLDDGVS